MQTLPTVPDEDDRRTCASCLCCRYPGPCDAVRRREIIASRNYACPPEILQRCIGYRPDRTDKDQRPGRIRWPGLTYQPIKETKKK